MSTVIRLNAPPFEPAAPTSLAALRRPLVDAQASRCDSHCSPCPACQAAQAAAVESARKAAQASASDLGLRLSQLVEDALGTHIARIETQQAELVSAVLGAVIPHLADTALRRALEDEILAATALAQQGMSLQLVKHPDLDLGNVPAGRLQIEDDPAQPRGSLSLKAGDGLSTLDVRPLIDACLARIGAAPGAADDNPNGDTDP
ncbi:MAG: hypothetical protein AAF311_07935 [Pseudomonadota bacterium]